AGFDLSTMKLQIGRRTSAGWTALASANWVGTANRDYAVLVVVDGQTVTLWLDGVSVLSYTFSTALNNPADPYSGYVDPLNDGMTGVGSDGAIMRLGEMSVRTLAPVITYSQTEEFDAN